MPDELWALVAPLLPAPLRPPYGGRHRTISDRVCFAAIGVHGPHLHPVAATTHPRAWLRPPATCWRRLTEWANAGVFDQLHLQVLNRLGEQGQLDWERPSVDTMSVRVIQAGGRGSRLGPGSETAATA